MRARDLVEPFPTVDLDTDALQVARMMGTHGLPGLIVCDGDGTPYTVLPGSEVLRFVIPRFVQDDPALSRAYDEKTSDELVGTLAGKTVRDMLPPRQDVDELPVVDHDATTIEVAAVMARMHSPVVAVINGTQLLGAITVSRLLAHWIPDTPDRR